MPSMLAIPELAAFMLLERAAKPHLQLLLVLQMLPGWLGTYTPQHTSFQRQCTQIRRFHFCNLLSDVMRSPPEVLWYEQPRSNVQQGVPTLPLLGYIR